MAWHVGLAGFIYSQCVIIVLYQNIRCWHRCERMYLTYQGRLVPSARPLWITTSAWNVNVKWVTMTGPRYTIPKHRYSHHPSPQLQLWCLHYDEWIYNDEFTVYMWGDMYSLLSIKCTAGSCALWQTAPPLSSAKVLLHKLQIHTFILLGKWFRNGETLHSAL